MSAVISECGQYRYRLDRVVDPMFQKRSVMFIGVNPSTADATQDDATIRKMAGFTRLWGYSSFIVGNVFAYRSTDVRQLPDSVIDAVGPENMAHLRAMMKECHLIVPCWGNTGKVNKMIRGQFGVMRAFLQFAEQPVSYFGVTLSGDPLHPLMLAYSTKLQTWRY